MTYVSGHTGNSEDQAIQFDGIDASVTTEASRGNIDAFSMSGWVNFTAEQTARTGWFGQNDVIEFGMINANNNELWMPASGALGIAFSPDTDGWTHIAVVADDPESIVHINGENSGSGGVGTPTAAGADTFILVSEATAFKMRLETALKVKSTTWRYGIWPYLKRK